MTEGPSNSRTSLIVVGVDGSPGSDAALAWAIDEARVRDAGLRAIYAWSYPLTAGPEGFIFLEPADLERDAKASLEAIVERVGGAGGAGAAIERLVLEGSASNALIEQSKGADLVVVGARGHGGFLGLLLGSVSNQVVHHATCPVVVVPSR